MCIIINTETFCNLLVVKFVFSMYSTKVRECSKWSLHVLYTSTSLILILIYCVYKNSIFRSLITSFLTNCQIFTASDNVLHDGRSRALLVQSMKKHRCGEVISLIIGVRVRWAWMFRLRFQPLSSRYSSNRKLKWPQNRFENCREKKNI